jgi:predicted nucleic acid-binding protein
VGKILAEQFPGVELLTVKTEITQAPSLPEPVCDDPDDDKFLACALASKVKLIISGDKHLVQASGYRGVEVVRPRRFVEEYLGKLRASS